MQSGKTKTFFVFCTAFFVNIHFLYPQIDSIHFSAAFAKMEEARTCFRQNPGSVICASMLKKAYEISGRHAFFFEEVLAYLVSAGEYREASDYLDISRIDTLSNSQKARYYHFRGLLQLRMGFYHFTRAYQSFREAYYCELRSTVPSFRLLSQIQNAMGYTRMIFGGPNLNGPKDYPHSNWVTPDLINSLKNFEQALYFDETNSNALANRDTIVAKIKASGMWVDEIELMVRPKPMELIRSELMIDEKSTNDTLDLMDVNLLPNNKEVLLNILQQYDELLLAVDISGSMDDIHAVKGVSRFVLMRELVLFLFHELPTSTQTGIVSVGGACRRQPQLYFPVEMDARKDVMDHMKMLKPDGNTPLIYSLTRGKELYTTRENKKALFLISDGMERCGPPLDLCILAGDLYALGIDLHIISFIMAGMEDSEFAYEIYHCMTRYSKGRIFRYDEEVREDRKPEPVPIHREVLLLPPILYGDNFKGIMHFEVNLSEFFER